MIHLIHCGPERDARGREFQPVSYCSASSLRKTLSTLLRRTLIAIPS